MREGQLEPAAKPRGMAAWKTWIEIFGVALRLGCTSFGGPIAHLGYFREEYVARRRWLDEKAYAGIVALCQFLPGPASSQVGIAIGLLRGGFVGAFLAWLGFTLPSALALALFALYVQGGGAAGAGWLRGLLVVAVAIVAHAVWGMARRLTPDRERASFAFLAAAAVLLAPSAWAQILVIAAGGVLGWALLRRRGAVDGGGGSRASRAERRSDRGGQTGGEGGSESEVIHAPAAGSRRWAAAACGLLFLGLLAGLPILRRVYPGRWLAVADSFYRAGSLVFGGGHVVLPLLAGEVVSPGWVSEEQFLAGYGAAQAVPGPLFTFAAYLGAVMEGWLLSIVALVCVFLPSFLLVGAALPLWEEIRRRAGFRAALDGINAAVVGILLAALYDPIWKEAIHSAADFCLALAAFGALVLWKAPSWIVVLLCAAGGIAVHAAYGPV